MIRKALRVGGWLLFGVLLVSLVAGQLLGQPILLSYVTSGSMEPIIDEGDGFATLPTALISPVEGDVVRESKETHAASQHSIRSSNTS